MKQLVCIITACFLFFLVAASDRQGQPIQEPGLEKLTKGLSTESEVRMAMGQPDTVWEEEDGARTLEYPKGPEGARTWMIDIGKDGKLKDYRQVLTEENFSRKTTKKRKNTKQHKHNKPHTNDQNKHKNEEVWDWRYLQPTQVPR